MSQRCSASKFHKRSLIVFDTYDADVSARARLRHCCALPARDPPMLLSRVAADPTEVNLVVTFSCQRVGFSGKLRIDDRSGVQLRRSASAVNVWRPISAVRIAASKIRSYAPLGEQILGCH